MREEDTVPPASSALDHSEALALSVNTAILFIKACLSRLVSSKLTMTFCCPVFFFSAVTPLQQWSAFCPRSCQREASVLFCMELQYVQMLQAQNPEQSENVSCTQGTEIHKHNVYHKLHREA